MTPDLARELAARLPDEPRWLEVRGMLLSGGAAITGGDSVETGFVARLLHDAFSAVAVVGAPPAEAIVAATEGVTPMTPLLAQTDNARHVGSALAQCHGPAWAGERAILHRLSLEDETNRPDGTAARPAPRVGKAPPSAAPHASDFEVRLLEQADSLDHLPPGLRYEMTHARNIAPVAAVFARGAAVSFCYPCWRTEALWDISIDTLEEHRGQALGQRAARFMIERMRQEGREPVWGALESNTASLRLARKLGFVPVDAIAWFSRGPWAFLTAGFQG